MKSRTARFARLGLSLAFVGVLLPTPAGATKQVGPGVNNPAPNILNVGSCIAGAAITDGPIPGSPADFARFVTPDNVGLYIQYQPYGETEWREIRVGAACSVGFLAPP
jgi:hypothetical protein